ncbi:MAG TPA: outer membrane protein assembly factor BamA [Candidatus Desulfofervidus auxilii]|uniref:Outer membrane protein assembly factor BamA n=1 Tax=Desulfofervidus auxilii TaxID=1621989 RepID=A0A7C0Y475_DESA2|nr:outer membrane protein assembly factor BamA [Candidatus Desulfofervidus auxilii]
MRRYLIFILLIILFCPFKALGKEKLEVSVAPFIIYAPKNMKNLGIEIAKKLEKKLPGDKIQIISWAEKPPVSLEEARKIGETWGIDYIIWGSLTFLGERISFDITIIETGGIRPPISIYKEIYSIEAIDLVLNDIVKEIIFKLFKKEKIVRLEILGHKGVDKDAILAVMKTKEGDLFNPRTIREDIKSIFKLGFFRDIKVEVEDLPQGKVVKFILTEKPLIKRIIIQGNKAIKEENIQEVIVLKPNTILKEDLLTKSIEQIKLLYQKEAYFDAQINYEIEPITEQEVKVIFKIQEGEKAYIKKIIFKGNKAFKDKTLKKLMKNKEKWFFSFITGSGKLKREELEHDVNRIINFYYNHGYINAKIGEPQIKHKGREIYIIIPIEEGKQYRVGQISFSGELIKTETKLKKYLKLKKGDIYNQEKLQKDIFALSDVYANYGFAYAEIEPDIKIRPENQTVNITYNIKKGPKVYIGRIEFEGNTKTRDKVIRRELWITEGETFNKEKLERSIESLHRLGYFEDIQVETEKGEELNELNLKIKVKEQPTGSFSIGAGYSSVEKFILMADITQRNLFGRGQSVTLRGYLGSITQRYTFDFTEPYLFDTNLSVGFQAFKWDTEYIDYTKESNGGEIRFSYPITRYSRIYWNYHYEKAKTADFAEYASLLIKELAPGITTSSISIGWSRDTRNRFFNPSKGSIITASIDFAGGPLGGDSAFTRYEGSVSVFIPLFWDTVGFIRTKMGYIQKRKKGILPLFEKYYLGGPYTIRGYDFATISPRDPKTGERIGGNKMFLCNLEFRFPIAKKLRLIGVIFFDMGNTYDIHQKFDITNLKKSVGAGIRWFSPMGPLRLEWGYALNAAPDESTSNWEFAIGTFF